MKLFKFCQAILLLSWIICLLIWLVDCSEPATAPRNDPDTVVFIDTVKPSYLLTGMYKYDISDIIYRDSGFIMSHYLENDTVTFKGKWTATGFPDYGYVLCLEFNCGKLRNLSDSGYLWQSRAENWQYWSKVK